MTSTTLTIGQVAKATGIGVETVRFYEREGLIHEPSRRASGYRQYDRRVIDRLRFIRRAKDLGFTLREIKGLLELRADPGSTCADVRRHAHIKINAIEEKIDALRDMKRALVTLTEACGNGRDLGDCPILDALEREANTDEN